MTFEQTLELYSNILKANLWEYSISLDVPYIYGAKNKTLTELVSMSERDKELLGDIEYFKLYWCAYGWVSFDWNVHKHDGDGEETRELEDFFQWQSAQDAVHIIFGNTLAATLNEEEGKVLIKKARDFAYRIGHDFPIPR